jgi:hypothetical protein
MNPLPVIASDEEFYYVVWHPSEEQSKYNYIGYVPALADDDHARLGLRTSPLPLSQAPQCEYNDLALDPRLLLE